ncbi:MAG: nuclear transport factor 2 family protein [Acuticoccus sp.]
MDEVQRTIETLRIHERLSLYTLTIDGGDPAGWAACFTQDGAFSQGGLVIRGRDRLRAYAGIHNRTLGSRHITASPSDRIAGDGRSATGRSTTVVTVATRTGFRIAMTGAYTDTLAKVDGEWLIAQRTVTVEGLPEDPAFPMLSSDPEIETLAQPLLNAWRRLGEPA